MKKLVKVTEVEGEGMIYLMGEKIVCFCMNYIYAGTLVGVNDICIELQDASIVYETGELAAKDWKDAQKLPSNHYVMLSAIESFGAGR